MQVDTSENDGCAEYGGVRSIGIPSSGRQIQAMYRIRYNQGATHTDKPNGTLWTANSQGQVSEGQRELEGRQL